eukprot:scaffold103718_cov56-Phaeocystis_antarctica.AAC.2
MEESDGAEGPRQRHTQALKGGHGERLRCRKQPQQAPLAQGQQLMRSPSGANSLHSARRALRRVHRSGRAEAARVCRHARRLIVTLVS